MQFRYKSEKYYNKRIGLFQQKISQNEKQMVHPWLYCNSIRLHTYIYIYHLNQKLQ